MMNTLSITGLKIDYPIEVPELSEDQFADWFGSEIGLHVLTHPNPLSDVRIGECEVTWDSCTINGKEVDGNMVFEPKVRRFFKAE